MGRLPTAAHLVSWSGRAPLDRQSGQRKGRGKRKKGNRYIGAATGETSVSAGRTQAREGARYRRLARRIGKDKAQGRRQQHPADGLPQAPVQPWHALPGSRRRLLRQVPQTRRKVRRHLAELDALGYDVIITPRPGQDDEGTGHAPAA